MRYLRYLSNSLLVFIWSILTRGHMYLIQSSTSSKNLPWVFFWSFWWKIQSVEFVHDPLFYKCFIWTNFYQSWPQIIIPQSCFPSMRTSLNPTKFRCRDILFNDVTVSSQQPQVTRRQPQTSIPRRKKIDAALSFFRRGRDRDKEPSNFFLKFEWKQFFFANGILKGRFLAANWKKMSTHRRRDKTNKTEWMFPKPRHFPENETVHSLPISSSSPVFFVGTGFEPVFRELSPILRCNFWICRNGTNVSKILCPWFLAT